MTILRGFMGSSLVQNCSHKEYMPTSPSARASYGTATARQCGALLTRMERDAEYEVETAAKKSVTVADESNNETAFDSSSCGESSDEAEEDNADERDSIFRHHSKKYARNRCTLAFLKSGAKNVY